MNPSFFQSRPFLISLVFLVIISALALWREVTGTIKIRKEIGHLEDQARELEENNRELKALVDYLDSPAYQEKAGREQLNLQAPGEVAVALPAKNADNSSSGQQSGPQENKSNPWRWWQYFFGSKS